MTEKVAQVAQLVASGAPFSLACKISGINLSADDIAKWPELDEIRQSVPSMFGGFGGSDDEPKDEEQPEKPKEEDEDDKDKSARARSVRVEMTEREKMVDEYAQSVLVPMERTFYTQLNRHFVSQRNSVMDNVDSWYDSAKSIAKLPAKVLQRQVENAPDIEKLLFDINKEIDRLMAAYRPTAKRAAEIEIAHINQELGGGITFNVPNELMDRWLVERMVLMGDIETATFRHAHEAIASAVSDAFDENLTVKELQQRIKQNVTEVYRVRLGEEIKPNGKFDLGGMSSSMTIARTEMGIITAQTRFDAFRSEGIEIWEWVTSKDDKVRDAHRMRDGQKVRVGEPFPVPINGAYVTYPRDPMGDVADLVNCRCVAVAVEEE
jgi:SPP1 gp7 family putative phage head morphogenesis protein